MAQVRSQNPYLATLTGGYMPVYAGEAFKQFLNRGNFGLVATSDNPKQVVPLMNMLPAARQGFLTYSTMIILFWIYILINGLYDSSDAIRSDNLMLEIFGRMPAARYVGPNLATNITVFMDQAVNLGLIAAPMTTYQIIADRYPPGTLDNTGKDISFKQEKASERQFALIPWLNYYLVSELQNDPNYIHVIASFNDPQIRNELIQEATIINDVNRQLFKDQRLEQLYAREANILDNSVIELANALEQSLVGAGYIVSPEFLRELRLYLNSGTTISIPDHNNALLRVIITEDALKALFARHNLVY